MIDQKKPYSNIPPETVCTALGGSEEGISRAVQYYDRYITTLCTMKVHDRYGEYMYSFVDEDLKQLMCIAIVRATVEFAAKIL